MFLSDVQKIKTIKNEAKRKQNARRAAQAIQKSLDSYEDFFQWPALFDSFRRDIKQLRALE
jgi:hypothetical protein